uniref:Uncharacterized protein n=1 Tax=Chromera velia CCMP2878 TaxID=1169474 RepID=A0A0G4HI19_9ALVE|mmetsp:Transcript_7922/g.15420  ORF Transcript_7922/g.15420 Transcript_7922/m.15420 type:complete len:109 (-) Transcript_7922:720-1046(-)|eukprot:Cvel_6941.t1-p1 / transcript=Cvel_6941.t1 / gene=Cvel_6941 / organism=Chromera_velia_CCMP2878 / gene_product=hypothetical protein / transcript_product=hypothetical protein / location=Cvel_scaffold351:76632-76955(-) / protein_length=108 / sequence_SO=supercontig / SO=protein_coding / is_pseudo=false
MSSLPQLTPDQKKMVRAIHEAFGKEGGMDLDAAKELQRLTEGDTELPIKSLDDLNKEIGNGMKLEGGKMSLEDLEYTYRVMLAASPEQIKKDFEILLRSGRVSLVRQA